MTAESSLTILVPEPSHPTDILPLNQTNDDYEDCYEERLTFTSAVFSPLQSKPPQYIKSRFYSVPCLLLTGTCFILSPVMVCIGTIYIEQCPKQPYIPMFLIVAGALTILSTVMSIFIRKSASIRYIYQEDTTDRGLMAITNLLHGITFSWYIAGCTWIYGAFQPKYEYEADTKFMYCNQNLYLFAFWLMSAVFILIGIIFLTALTFLVLGIATKLNSANLNV